MISLGTPLFLWAFAGLALPIAIHFLSRKEGKVLRLGSLRHVLETSTQQFKGLRLNEILLLVLRCLIIMLLTLFLCNLHWNNLRSSHWLIIEKGLEKDIPLLETFIEKGYETHWLAPGFPLVEDSASSEINYPLLMEELEKENPDSAIIFSKNATLNFEGPSIALPDKFKWIGIAQDSLNYTLGSFRSSPDSLTIRRGHTSSDETSFTTEQLLSIGDSASAQKHLKLLVVSDKQHEYDRNIFLAIIKSINQSIPVTIEVVEISSTSPSYPSADWIMWLSSNKVPPGIKGNLVYYDIGSSVELLVPEGKNTWKLTQRLNEDVVLRNNFTVSLSSLLIPVYDLMAVADSNDRRMMPDEIIQAPPGKVVAQQGRMISAQPFLFVLMLFTLIVERIIAYRRNQ